MTHPDDRPTLLEAIRDAAEPEIADEEFAPWSDADRAADYGDLLGEPE